MSLLPISAPTVVIVAFLAIVLPQVALTLWFAWIVRQRTQAFVAREGVRQQSASVPAEVILCLRGCDPTLDDVFAALAKQSHREWRLRVVVDSTEDPAWKVAHAAVARLGVARPAWKEHVIEPLARRPLRGSLKCASLRQALRSLAPETRVVALIDADSVVHSDWLLTMVDECLRPGVGAVSGNRWYAPDRNSPTATVRAIWNAGAIVQMTTFGIPWGGSLAVRREAVKDCRWDDVIEGTLCEDTALAAPLARAGWAYRFVPALTAIDQADDISFGPLTRWIARQLLTTRLHHPAWPVVALHGIATSLSVAVMLLGAVAAWLTSHDQLARLLGGTFLAYEGVNLLLLATIASSIRVAVAATGRQTRPFSPGHAVWWFMLIPAAQGVHAVAVLATMIARSIEWRGVTYRLLTLQEEVPVRWRSTLHMAVAGAAVVTIQPRENAHRHGFPVCGPVPTTPASTLPGTIDEDTTRSHPRKK